MKKIFILVLFLCFISKTYLLFAAAPSFHSIEKNKKTPIIQKCIKKIKQVPEIRKLISSIQKEGPINARMVNSKLANTFGAYWNPANRTICLGIFPGITEGKIIGSILFELQNAKENSKIEKIYHKILQGKIGKKEYVESMERLEYENSKKASLLASKGIEMGIFPTDAYLPTYRTFEEHFKAQKRSGHSAWFEQNYDKLKNFRN